MMSYIANFYDFRTIDLANPATPAKGGSLALPRTVFDVAAAGNYAYVADGENDLRVVDVSNPASPIEVGSLGTPGWAKAIAARGSYAYMAGDSLRIIDVSDPAVPREVGFWTGGTLEDVAVAGNFAYLVSPSESLRILDIANPVAPVSVGSYRTTGWAYGVAVVGTYAYVAEIGSLSIVDVSSPANPKKVGGYTHALGYSLAVVVVDKYAYLMVQGNGLHIVDVSSPSSPTEVGFFVTAGTAEDITVAADGKLAYVADGDGGLWILRVAEIPPTATPTATPTTAPTPTITPTPTPTWAPAEANVSRGAGTQTLVSNNGSVRVTIPASVLPPTVTSAVFHFAPVATPTPGASAVITPAAVLGSPIFELTGRDAANGTPFRDLAAPLTLAVAYAEDTAFIERGLRMYRRATVSDTWTTEGILGQKLDAAANLAVGQVITLGQFALLGPPSERLYLPAVCRGCSAAGDTGATSTGGW